MESNGSNEPGLGHTSDHTGDTEAEGGDGSDTRRELAGLVVVSNDVAGEASLEDKVVAKGNTLINGEPVTNEVHEVLEDGFEVRVTRNGNGNVYTSCNTSPDETRDALSPSAENLDGQTDGVKVGAVVGDNGKSQDDEAELSEGSERGEKDCGEQTTGTRSSISSSVFVVSTVEGCGSHNCETQHLSEEERNNQTKEGPPKDLKTALSWWLVNSVVGGVAGPASCETIDGGTEGENTTHL